MDIAFLALLGALVILSFGFIGLCDALRRSRA